MLGPIAIPERIERMLDGARVGELTVISRVGRPISHPMIPLYDGEKLYVRLERPVLQEAHADPSRMDGGPRMRLPNTAQTFRPWRIAARSADHDPGGRP